MNDYPSDAELEELKTANIFKVGFKGMVDLINDSWNHDYGKLDFDGKSLKLATGGWSGNEDLICALQENIGFWSSFWIKTERGGRFTFRED